MIYRNRPDQADDVYSIAEVYRYYKLRRTVAYHSPDVKAITSDARRNRQIFVYVGYRYEVFGRIGRTMQHGWA